MNMISEKWEAPSDFRRTLIKPLHNEKKHFIIKIIRVTTVVIEALA